MRKGGSKRNEERGQQEQSYLRGCHHQDGGPQLQCGRPYDRVDGRGAECACRVPTMHQLYILFLCLCLLLPSCSSAFSLSRFLAICIFLACSLTMHQRHYRESWKRGWLVARQAPGSVVPLTSRPCSARVENQPIPVYYHPLRGARCFAVPIRVKSL